MTDLSIEILTPTKYIPVSPPSSPIKKEMDEINGINDSTDTKEMNDSNGKNTIQSTIQQNSLINNKHDKHPELEEKVILYLHGGGYCAGLINHYIYLQKGSAKCNRSISIPLAEMSETRVIALDYR